jgi:hypothetical protein
MLSFSGDGSLAGRGGLPVMSSGTYTRSWSRSIPEVQSGFDEGLETASARALPAATIALLC